MRHPKTSSFTSVAAVREALARLGERGQIPRRLNKIIPREGTSHPGVARVCKKIWSYHDRLFPRACEFCIHFDFKLGQDSLSGRSVENEQEAVNLTAQQHLLRDYVWDVEGREVTMDPESLGGCNVHEAYVTQAGVCEHFERIHGGALVPPEQRVIPKPEEVTGWHAAVNPLHDGVEVPEAVVYPPTSTSKGDCSESDSN